MAPGIPARDRPIPHATDTARPDSVRAAAPLVSPRCAPRRAAAVSSRRHRLAAPPRGCRPALRSHCRAPAVRGGALSPSLSLSVSLSRSLSLSLSHLGGLRGIGWVQELLAFAFALRATQASRGAWSAQCLCSCAGTWALLRGTVPGAHRAVSTRPPCHPPSPLPPLPPLPPSLPLSLPPSLPPSLSPFCPISFRCSCFVTNMISSERVSE